MIDSMVKRLGVVLIALAALMPTQSANAATSGNQSKVEFAQQARSAGLDQQQIGQLQAEVDKYIVGMKVGGRQISANEIMSSDGRMKITIPVPGEQRVRSLSTGVLATCGYGHLCLYDGINFSGLLRDLYACGGIVNLGNYGVNDRLSSYINNQTSGTVARFYNWEGKWVYKFGSTAPHSDYDLSRWGLSNLIDGVDTC